MSQRVSDALRQRLQQVDGFHCAYCQTSELVTGQPLTIDHIHPVALGGATSFENLCRACRRCNEFKGANRTAVDPLTGNEVALFHPRQQEWADHFTWSIVGIYLEGHTAVGRATIVQLQVNDHPQRGWLELMHLEGALVLT